MRWAGFVRNVMLGREGLHRDVLLALVEEAGGADVRSHLTTGNVTFETPPELAREVGRRTETGIAHVIGRPEPVILRELSWLQDFMADDSFGPYRNGAWALEVGFLPLDVAPLDPARLPDPGATVILRVGRRELVTARPAEGGQRPHVVSMLEAATGARATSRGWTTLEKVVAHGA